MYHNETIIISSKISSYRNKRQCYKFWEILNRVTRRIVIQIEYRFRQARQARLNTCDLRCMYLHTWRRKGVMCCLLYEDTTQLVAACKDPAWPHAYNFSNIDHVHHFIIVHNLWRCSLFFVHFFRQMGLV